MPIDAPVAPFEGVREWPAARKNRYTAWLLLATLAWLNALVWGVEVYLPPGMGAVLVLAPVIVAAWVGGAEAVYLVYRARRG